MAVRCGFAVDHPDRLYHDTTAEVAACSRRHYAEKTAPDAETQADDEAALQDAIEARQGVIPFDVALREAEAPIRPGTIVRQPRVDWAAIGHIPVGGRGSAHYALLVDGEVKFYLVERSDTGKWAGRTFAKVQAGPAYHRLEKGAQIGVLARIAADPLAAATLYAREVGRCSQCGADLTDEASRARGMGPVCANRFGGVA